jgi:hypothetical protein
MLLSVRTAQEPQLLPRTAEDHLHPEPTAADPGTTPPAHPVNRGPALRQLPSPC